jgi:hypothetical protein
MVKCVAFDRKSGYKGQPKFHEGVKISFHSFSTEDKVLCDKWIKAVPRKDFVPSKHSKFCSRHFQRSDFVQQTRDTNKWRRKSNNYEELAIVI